MTTLVQRLRERGHFSEDAIKREAADRIAALERELAAVKQDREDHADYRDSDCAMLEAERDALRADLEMAHDVSRIQEVILGNLRTRVEEFRGLLASCGKAMILSQGMQRATDWTHMILAIDTALAQSETPVQKPCGCGTVLCRRHRLASNEYCEFDRAQAGLAQETFDEQCETCGGTGEIDLTLGGISTSDPNAPCPDCRTNRKAETK